MNAKQSITASVALAALATAWFTRHWQDVAKGERKFDEKCQQDALETFESEGGLVLA